MLLAHIVTEPVERIGHFSQHVDDLPVETALAVSAVGVIDPVAQLLLLPRDPCREAQFTLFNLAVPD